MIIEIEKESQDSKTSLEESEKSGTDAEKANAKKMLDLAAAAEKDAIAYNKEHQTTAGSGTKGESGSKAEE
jgi:hypothetical protein